MLLSKPHEKTIYLNPTDTFAEKSVQLSTFFANQPPLEIWRKNQVYTVQGNNYLLTHDVIGRPRKGDKIGRRYEIIDTAETLGEGTTAAVFPIVGTLAWDQPQMTFNQHKPRVVKIQEHTTKKHPLIRIREEYEISRQATHLAIKRPMTKQLAADLHESYTVMKKMPGYELLDILLDDEAKKIPLTTSQRLNITKRLLSTFKEQVKDKAIIHRDVKPENVIVDLNSEPITVNYIDFGLSVFADKSDKKYAGSPGYIAPEIHCQPRQKADYKSDVFSLARILSLLWVDQTPDTEEHLYTNSYINYDCLFGGIHDLSKENQQKIKTILTMMSLKKLKERITLERAIFLFDAVLLSDETMTPPICKANEMLVIYRELHECYKNLQKWNLKKPLKVANMEIYITALREKANLLDLFNEDQYTSYVNEYNDFIKFYSQFRNDYHEKATQIITICEKLQGWSVTLDRLTMSRSHSVKSLQKYNRQLQEQIPLLDLLNENQYASYLEDYSNFEKIAKRKLSDFQNNNVFFQPAAPAKQEENLSPLFQAQSR